MNPAHFAPQMMGQQQLTAQQQQQLQQQQQHRLVPLIIQKLQQQPQIAGWQSQVPVSHRAQLVYTLFNQIRPFKQDVPEENCLANCMRHESEKFVNCKSIADYQNVLRELMNNMNNMKKARQHAAQNAMMQAGGNVSTPQMSMPQQTPMQPVGSNQGQNAFQQPFPPQLQHPMQPSPMPVAHQPPPMGLDNSNQPGMVQQPTPQQIQQMQQMQQMRQAQSGQLTFTQEDKQRIHSLMHELRAKVTPEEEARIRAEIQGLPADRRQMLDQRFPNDPVMWSAQQKAIFIVTDQKKRAAQPAQLGQQPGQMPGMPGRPIPNPAMFQRTPQMSAAQSQQSAVPGNAEFDFAQLAGQQADAMRSAQAGHDVVPASNNPSVNQMGGFGSMPSAQPGQMNAQGAGGPSQAPNIPAGGRPQSMQQLQQMQRDQVMRQMAAQAQSRQGLAPSTAGQMAFRGQMGGLSMGPGPMQNGGMPNLTRGMVPPGQQAGGTPQQRPQQPTPQMTPNMGGVGPGLASAQQALQAAQHRAAVAQAHMPGASAAPRANQIPPDVPPQLREKLMLVGEDQFRNMLGKWIQNRGTAGMQSAAVGMNQSGSQMNPQALHMQGPHMMSGANSQFLPPGQQPPGGGTNPQSQMQQRFHQQQENLRQQQARIDPQIIQKMDAHQFPQQIATHLNIAIPESLKTWGQLKEWVQRNQSSGLPNQLLLKYQLSHYQKLLQVNQQLNGRRPGMPNTAAPALGHPNGQAPQAPMVPPATVSGSVPPQNPLQQQQQQRMQSLEVTPFEIQRARSTFKDKVAGMTDEQLRQSLMHMKAGAIHKLTQQNGQAQVQHPATANVGMPHGQGSQTAVAQAPLQPTPQTKMATQVPPGPAMTPQSQPQKTLKRPSSEDVVEVPDPSLAQAQPMQPSNSQQQLPLNLTPKQIAGLTPAQRQRLQAAQNARVPTPSNQQAQVQTGQQTDARTRELQTQFMSIFQQGARNAQLQQRAPVPLTVEERKEMDTKLRLNHNLINKLDQCLMQDYVKHRDEKRTKGMTAVRHLIHAQFEPQTRNLKDVVNVNMATVDGLLGTIAKFVKSVFNEAQAEKSQQQINGHQSGPQQPGQQPVAPTASGVEGHAELSAANLQTLKQQTTAALHRRQHSQNKAPAAPTTSQPPFSFAGVGGGSPHGAPVYPAGNSNELTPDKLKMPVKKKPKIGHVGSAASTPANGTPAPTSSPQVANKPSPDMRRHDAPHFPAPARPRFPCSNQTCDYSARGFETKEELETHTKEAHAVIDDPIEFACGNLAESLGLNRDGSTKASKSDANAAGRSKPTPSAKPPQPQVKTGQTPAIKAEIGTPAVGATAATPMNRVPTQTGLKGSPSANLKTPQAAIKTQTPGSGGAQAMLRTPSKLGKDTSKPTEAAQATMELDAILKTGAPRDPWENSVVSPATLKAIFDGEDMTRDILAADPALFDKPRNATPVTTPSPSSTKASEKSNSSDISENDKLNINIDADLDMDRELRETNAEFARDMEILLIDNPTEEPVDWSNYPAPASTYDSNMDFEELFPSEKKISGWDDSEAAEPRESDFSIFPAMDGLDDEWGAAPGIFA